MLYFLLVSILKESDSAKLYSDHNLNQMASTTPFFFSFNLRRSVFQQLGNHFFRNIAQKGVKMVPVINNLDEGVVARGKNLNRFLREYLERKEIESCHLVSYSLSGIDARYALSELGLDQKVKSLTTIATPHLGSKLAWLAQKQIFSDKKSQPIARLLGVGLRPFWEITHENMRNFNIRTPNSPRVQYYSIGAERLPNNMCHQLRQTGQYLRSRNEKNFIYENDGVVGHDECQWGQHLVNFEADHAQIVGISPSDHLDAMVQLIKDNVEVNLPYHAQQQS